MRRLWWAQRSLSAVAFSPVCFFKRTQREPSQPLAGSQARSKDISSSVPQSPQLHPTRHFPDFPVSPEMLTSAPASSALWHDLVAFPPTFNEIRESGMSFTQWVLLLNSRNKRKHQNVCCQSQERLGMTSLWKEKHFFWWNISSQKSSFQGCSGAKQRKLHQGGIREGSTWQGVALTQVIWMLLIIRDDSLLFTLHQVLWKALHLSALTHCYTTWG